MTASRPFVPPQWSSDGTKIIIDWWEIPYLVDTGPDPPMLKRIVAGNYQERFYPRISPDGLRIVFSTERHASYGLMREIGVSNLDGSEYRRLTKNRYFQSAPEWSPDSSHIAFFSKPQSSEDIYYRFHSLYTMSASGTGPQKLVESVRPFGLPVWSPDGRKIALLSRPRATSGDGIIYVIDRDGSNAIKIPGASSQPAWSPDGSSIAFLRGEKRESLHVVNPDGSGLRKLVDLDPDTLLRRNWYPELYLSWSPDGSEILLRDYPFIFVKADGTDYPEGESPYAVFADSQDWRRAYASWSPDGSRIAITVERMGEFGPIVGDAVLLTMARDGSDKRVLVRHGHEYRPYAVPNEPWEGEGEWVWHSP